LRSGFIVHCDFSSLGNNGPILLSIFRRFRELVLNPDVALRFAVGRTGRQRPGSFGWRAVGCLICDGCSCDLVTQERVRFVFLAFKDAGQKKKVQLQLYAVDRDWELATKSVGSERARFARSFLGPNISRNGS
jgi:hypothetical protein